MEHEVVDPGEADFIIGEAERYAGQYGWTTRRHAEAPTVDLPHSVLPATWPLLNRTFDRVIQGAFLNCGLEQGMDGLTIHDLFIVKYTPSGQPGLRKHRDSSFMSFNLHLTSPSDHVGGGTHFPAKNETYKIPKGSVLYHGGNIDHIGIDVTSGVRYIAVGFLGSDHGCCLQFQDWAKAWLKSALVVAISEHDDIKAQEGPPSLALSMALRLALVLGILALSGGCYASWLCFTWLLVSASRRLRAMIVGSVRSTRKE